VAVVLTPVQTKQIRINTYKRNNTKYTVQTIQNTVNTGTHITKTPTRTHTQQYTEVKQMDTDLLQTGGSKADVLLAATKNGL
jgi:hypothetical protein